MNRALRAAHNNTITVLSAVLLLFACTEVTDSQSGPDVPLTGDQLTQVMIGDNNDISAATIRDGYRVHAALAQFFRWFQPLDNSQVPRDYFSDLLIDDTRFSSLSGEGQGQGAFLTLVENVPENWQNSHFVREVKVRFANDGAIRLEADVTYMNTGMLERDAVFSADLTFQSTLVSASPAEGTPKVKKVDVQIGTKGKADMYRSSYAENRLKSLFYHWLYLLENPERKASQFKLILSDEFTLNFPEKRIASTEELGNWINGVTSTIQFSHYRLRSFKIETLGVNQYAVTAEMDWYGLTENGEEKTGRKLQEFTALDDPKMPYAVITSIREQDLEIDPLLPDEGDV